MKQVFCLIKKRSFNLLCVLDLFSECWQSTLFQIFKFILLVWQGSGLVENFYTGTFSDTINVMSNFAWWHYTPSFTCSLHSQWPWHYFEVTAVSNGFNWTFYVLTWLRWNFVGLLSTSSRSWIYHYFLLSHIFKGDDWCVSWFDKSFTIVHFADTVQVRFLKLCIIITLLGIQRSYQV